MAYSRVLRPASLEGVEERLRITVEESGEGWDPWIEALGCTRKRFRVLMTGVPTKGSTIIGRLGPKDLLIIDDMCDRHFLTPPERAYAEESRKRTARSSRWRNA